jgi:hypothetical protein
MGRFLGLFVTLLLGMLCMPAGAAASCAAPTFAYAGGDVRAGDTVTVVGQFWGDDCHDTGDRPDGEGVLGRPRTDIVVMFLQSGTETVVARGDADAGYAFEVDIEIPSTAVLGEARLSARAGDLDGHRDSTSREPLTVTSVGDGSPVGVAYLGPAGALGPGSTSGAPEPTTATGSRESAEPTASPGQSLRGWWPAATAAFLLVLGVALLGLRGRRTTRQG